MLSDDGTTGEAYERKAGCDGKIKRRRSVVVGQNDE